MLTVAVSFAFILAQPGCREEGGDGDLDSDADLDLDPPVAPVPCESSACVAYCRQVGAESGTCSGADCECTGCDLDRCDGYCYWWQDRSTADDAACADGGCTCVPCAGSCQRECASAREYAGLSSTGGQYFDGSCDGTRCSCECEAEGCANACAGFGALGRCRDYDCLCTCSDDICFGECRDMLGGLGELRCQHYDAESVDDLGAHELCVCEVAE